MARRTSRLASGEYPRSGRVRPIDAFGVTRHSGYPQVPMVEESLGLRGFQTAAWQGLVVPARTTPADLTFP